MISQIVDSTSRYVSELFSGRLPDTFRYHTPAHTREVADACLEIGRGLGLSARELELLQLAAWFHDTGYVDAYEGHEQISANIAREFLLTNGYPEADIVRVTGLILATYYPHHPMSLMEEVIRDADLIYLARPHYREQSETLRVEWKNLLGREYTDDEWLDSNIEFFEEHSYYTPYARAHYGAPLQRNLQELVMIRDQMR